ncbi:MAG: hypothetical protein QOG45_2273, partial [Chloroflexota bacterium]|nr:hypothetical protein [Chloroflexota bacterium]
MSTVDRPAPAPVTLRPDGGFLRDLIER